jgi:hypothetical protein
VGWWLDIFTIVCGRVVCVCFGTPKNQTTKTVAFFAVEQRLGSCWWWGNPRVVIAVVFVVGAASALFLHSSSHQQSQKTNAANYEYSRKCRRTTFVVANGGRDDDRWGHI